MIGPHPTTTTRFDSEAPSAPGTHGFRTGRFLERHSPVIDFRAAERNLEASDSSDADDVASTPSQHSSPSSSGAMVRDAHPLPVLDIVRDGADAPQAHVSRTGKRDGINVGKAFAVIVTFAAVGIAAGFSMRAFTARQVSSSPFSEATSQAAPLTGGRTSPMSPMSAPALSEPMGPALAAAVLPSPAKLPPPPPPAPPSTAGASASTRGAAVTTSAKPARVVHGATRPSSVDAARVGAAPTAGRVHPRPAAMKPHRVAASTPARVAAHAAHAAHGGQSAHTQPTAAKKPRP
jgi:hypothetical protein